MYIHQSRQNTQSSTSSSTSSRSDGSAFAPRSTASSIETFYSDASTPIAYDKAARHIRYEDDISVTESSGYFDEPQDIDYGYSSDHQSYEPASYGSFEAIATSPEDFAEYFPTRNQLNIQHDTTSDGNMNLVISTEVPEGPRKVNKQLFHLRMHELVTRTFSLRRYCRESGREVANSVVRRSPPTGQRPTIGRSVSNALSALRRQNSAGSTKSDKSAKSVKIIRQDSGYESENSAIESDIEDEEDELSDSSAHVNGPSNNIKLEFSNYAQVDVKRRGAKANKHWSFEYWGTNYSWRRNVTKDAVLGKSFSYHLIKTDFEVEVARITANPRTAEEQREEELMGGWVPPSSLWIHDERILKESSDVADVIVATGLIALTDDCVRRLEKKRDAAKKPTFSRQLSFKVGKTEKLDMEAPRKMIEHVFSKGKKHDKERPSTPRRTGTGKSEKMVASPLRHHTPAALY